MHESSTRREAPLILTVQLQLNYTPDILLVLFVFDRDKALVMAALFQFSNNK